MVKSFTMKGKTETGILKAFCIGEKTIFLGYVRFSVSVDI